MAAARLKCLFVAPAVPYPPDSGGRIRTYRMLRELRGAADVHLRAVLDGPDAAARLRELAPQCASVAGFERAPPGAWFRLTRTKPERWFFSPALATALRAELAREQYDLVHLDESCLSRALDLGRATPIVIHHHKLDTRFETIEPPPDPVARALERLKRARLEASAARRTKFHVLTSAEDALALASRFPGLETSVVESGFDPGSFFPSITRREQTELLFLGSLDYWPNIDGATWFVRDVLPRIAAARPDVRLSIVGRAPAPAVRALAGPNVSVIGQVDDVRPHLQRAAALVVPLRIGGGTRVKIVEALGCETPVVSTTIGAEGLAFRDPEHLWIADGAQELAQRTLAALADPREAVARARRGRVLALQRYTWADLARRLLAVWDQAALR